MAAPTWTEDEIGRTWDRCITDAVFKLGGGLFLGGVFSLLLFKRRKWPILTGAGFGLGMAYANCQKDLNSAVGPEKSTSKCTRHDEGKKPA